MAGNADDTAAAVPAAAAAEARRAGLWASAAGGTKARRAAKAETANLDMSQGSTKIHSIKDPPSTQNWMSFLLLHYNIISS